MIWLIRIVVLVVTFTSVSNCLAYKTETHNNISKYGAERSTKRYEIVKDISLNSEDLFKGELSAFWIQHGSKWEDGIQLFGNLPLDAISFCHFYNPLTDMGYTDSILSLEKWQSLVTRAVDPNNEWSYQNARKLYYSALTGNSTYLDGLVMNDGFGWWDSPIVGTTKMNFEGKEQFFTWMFQALGHTMHLIQDASVPAHTRNDLHGPLEPYEWWTEKNFIYLDYEGNTTDPNIFLNSNSSIIAPYDFFDTGQLDENSESPLTSSFQGLAEYSHANFLSYDTIFGQQFPVIC